MSDLISRMRRVVRQATAEKGPFVFFALFQREESQKWDVLAAAPWVDEDEGSARSYIANLIVKNVPLRDRLGIFRISILESKHPALLAFIQKLASAEHSHEVLGTTGIHLGPQNIFGRDLNEAVILAAGLPEAAAGRPRTRRRAV